jgi:hypothetical protein
LYKPIVGIVLRKTYCMLGFVFGDVTPRSEMDIGERIRVCVTERNIKSVQCKLSSISNSSETSDVMPPNAHQAFTSMATMLTGLQNATWTT